MTVKAKIIADSIGEHGARITTFELYIPRFLLAELNTHRVITKNAASSRAIPVNRRIEMVMVDPYIPDQFGKNRPGMQSTEVLDADTSEQARALWLAGRDEMVRIAKTLADIEVHKQFANRILEPWAHVAVCVTATEWDNFWWLRASKDAQPEFEALARLMRELYTASSPVRTIHHLPYVDDETRSSGLPITDLYQISAARCARVSYQTFDGRKSTIADDRELCQKLLSSGHLSPFDQPAMADHIELSDSGARWSDPDAHRQYWGWIPYRVDIEHQIGRIGRRNSHAYLY